MADWGEIFRPSTPLVEVVVRGTVMFLTIFALMRLRDSGSPASTL